MHNNSYEYLLCVCLCVEVCACLFAADYKTIKLEDEKTPAMRLFHYKRFFLLVPFELDSL